MKIAVIADTHLPKKAKKLPSEFIEGIKGVDLILHAGDWTTLEVLRQLEDIAPVEGVHGNVDEFEVKAVFPEKKTLRIKSYSIGIVHGHNGSRKTTPERALEAFQGQCMDVIVFGHSHIPYKELHDSTLLINPGSPTDKRFQLKYSYGILQIGTKINFEHFFF